MIPAKVEKYQKFKSRSLSLYPLRACLHGGGGPQVGEVTCLYTVHHMFTSSDQSKMRDYIERLVKPP